jgi:hypothetical protein
LMNTAVVSHYNQHIQVASGSKELPVWMSDRSRRRREIE